MSEISTASRGVAYQADDKGDLKRITVSSPVLYRRQVGHLLAANVGSAMLALACVAWTIVDGVEWPTLVIALLLYVLTGAGVELGLHRGCAHAAFKAPRWLRFVLAALGAMAAQGPPSYWVANHRRHHAYSDRDGDPHSPRDGFWHAHMAWLLDRQQTLTPRFAPDLLKDPDIRWIDRHYGLIVMAGLLVPGILAGIATWSLSGFISGLLWGGGMRLFVVQHGTFFINSGCHRFGSRPFQTRDLATNFWPMAWPTFGQSLHNTHHAFPDAATTALLKGDLDPGGMLLWGLAHLGLVSDLKIPNRDAVAAKLQDEADFVRIRLPREPRPSR